MAMVTVWLNGYGNAELPGQTDKQVELEQEKEMEMYIH